MINMALQTDGVGASRTGKYRICYRCFRPEVLGSALVLVFIFPLFSKKKNLGMGARSEGVGRRCIQSDPTRASVGACSGPTEPPWPIGRAPPGLDWKLPPLAARHRLHIPRLPYRIVSGDDELGLLRDIVCYSRAARILRRARMGVRLGRRSNYTRFHLGSETNPYETAGHRRPTAVP